MPPTDACAAIVILTVFLIVTFIAHSPAMAVASHCACRGSRKTFPHRYHRFVAWLFGIHIRVIGARPVTGRGVLILANHTGWMDIVIFSAVMPLSFVAKSEVASWPFFGTLARLQRTVFVDAHPAQPDRRGAR